MTSSQFPKVEPDLLCWHCDEDAATLKCGYCNRSFHRNCEINSDAVIEEDNWRCSVCFAIDEKNDKENELKMLPVLMNKIWKEKSLNLLKKPIPWGDCSKSITNAIDLIQIKEKIDEYTSFAEFQSDISWIRHNSVLLYTDDHEITNAARVLSKLVEDEITDIKNCSECYENAVKYPKRWFTMVCSKLHIVVWAKLPGFTHWPSKVMAINDQQISIDFFGDHTQAKVPAKSCYLYSNKSPKPPRTTSKTYLSALEECNAYIQNVRNKCGSYKLAETKTIFDPASYEDYIDGLFKVKEEPATVLDSEEEDDDGEMDSIMDLTSDTEEATPSNQIYETFNVDLSKPGIQNGAAAASGANMKRKNASTEDQPLQKKVRFSDEFGGQLAQVHLVERHEYSPDRELADTDEMVENHTNGSHENESMVNYVDIEEKTSNGAVLIASETGCTKIDDENSTASTGKHTFEKIVQSMRFIQGSVLDLMHLHELKTQALNSDLMTSREEFTRELTDLREKNKQLSAQLQMVKDDTAIEIKNINKNFGIQIAEHIEANNRQNANEIEALKMEHAKQLADIEQKFNDEKAELMEVNNREKIDLINEIDALKEEKRAKVTEMQQKIHDEKVNYELKLKQKCIDIADQVRKNVEKNMKCKGCGIIVEYCSAACKQTWNTWKDPKVSDSDDGRSETNANESDSVDD
ncbi:uncharacterized protein LOC116350359 isoform X2 [Contarinia nasturtii]|uniref:uncharacterized protein LOC116350359 isoform X2 n=1 Tax=Contarinia nasturtii TaxID=265458 RepID=UPI0012D3B7AE|nr:uncharacterized protein LOC116350359 isoform X2 [Contarinia nasturtii]